MQENTNKSLAINSLILYVRLALVSVCSLLTARYSLQALGLTDYGLFSLLGSIISFVGIINTIMISTSNRFIAVAIGKGNLTEANKQFNVNLVIHIGIALFTMMIAIPIGDWYICHFVNYEGDINNALMVFHYSVISSIISFIGVPYNGLLMAKERFMVFCTTDVISSFFKMIVAYILTIHFVDKLWIYSLTIALLTAYPTLVFIVYCSVKFPEITKLTLVKEKKKYKEVFSFSSWVAFGAIITVGRNQGTALLVNAFFNTLMNTALGIASSLNSMLMTFAHNISKPISPQITKSYTNNKQRCAQLLIMSSKMTYLMMLFISSPFLLQTEWILKIWLGEVPPYVCLFTQLIIIETLIDSLNSGVSELIFASGKIKFYQIITNLLRIASLFLAFIFLKLGLPAHYIFYSYILCTISAFFARQWVLKRTLNFDISLLFKKAYIPCLTVTLLFIPFIFIKLNIHPITSLFLLMFFLSSLIVFIGLDSNERSIIKNLFH